MIKRLMAIFVQGLVAVLPLAVTCSLLVWLGASAERMLGAAIQWVLPDVWYVPGMGVLTGLVLIFAAGLLVNTWGIPHLIGRAEKVIGRIPLVKTIYGAMHDLLGFFSKPDGAGGVSQVVMASLDDTGIRVVGLLTREEFDGLPAGLGGPQDVAVYVPFSYQIGGFTLILPRTCVQPLDMSLEDAMRFIVTAGASDGGRSSREQAVPDTDDGAMKVL